MKLDYLRCIRKYLQETREGLGIADFSIVSTYDPKCIYGTTDICSLITDVNSVYLINKFKLLDELFISSFNGNVSKLVNTECLVNDLIAYSKSLEKVSILDANDLLAYEQRYFYESILKENIQSFYDEKKEVLLGFSEMGCGYVYVPTLKSTNCR